MENQGVNVVLITNGVRIQARMKSDTQWRIIDDSILSLLDRRLSHHLSLTNQEIILVRQYRHGAGEVELPAILFKARMKGPQA